MTDELKRVQDQLARDLAGPTPVEQQIILLKLTDLFENPPKLGVGVGTGSPERRWYSTVSALVKKYDRVHFGIRIDSLVRRLNKSGADFDIVDLVGDVIEVIKLDLELDGRSDIGTVYKPGEAYQFYADMKDIIAAARKEIYLIDAYLTGQAFDEFFGVDQDIGLRLLVSKSAAEIKTYADRHSQQYQTNIEVRKSKEIHDRLIIADQGDAWVIGGSLNMKGDKPTYLLPLSPGVAEVARDLYSAVWGRSNPVS